MNNRVVEYIYRLRDRFSANAHKMSRASRMAARSAHALGMAADRAGIAMTRLAMNMKAVRRAGRQMVMRRGGLLGGLGSGIGVFSLGKTLYNFEDRMNHIQALTSLSKDKMKSLREEIIDIGGKSMFTASQVASGSVELAKAGVRDLALQRKLLDGVVMLSESTNTPMNKAADIVTNITKAFGMSISKDTVTDMVDSLSHAARRTNFDILQLSESMKNTSSTAHKYGMSMKDTTAILMSLAQRGEKGGRAGRGLARIITRASNLTPKAQKLLVEAGIDTKTWHDSQGNIKIFDIIKQIRDAENRDWHKGRAASAEAFGLIGNRMMMTLTSAKQSEIDKFRYEMAESKGAASEQRVARMQGLPGAWRYLVASVEKLILTLGTSGLIDDLISILNSFRNLATSISQMDKGTLRLIGRAVLAFAAISALSLAFSSFLLPIGVLIWSIGTIIPILTAVGTLFTSFAGALATGLASTGLALGPLLLLLAGIAAAAYVVYQNWSSIKEWLGQIWESIKLIFKGSFNVILGIIQGDWERFKTGIGEILAGIITLVANLVRGIIEGVIGSITTLLDGMGSLGTKIKGGLGTAWESVSSFFSGLSKNTYVDKKSRMSAARTMTAENILNGAYGSHETKKIDVNSVVELLMPSKVTLNLPDGTVAGSIPLSKKGDMGSNVNTNGKDQ